MWLLLLELPRMYLSTSDKCNRIEKIVVGCRECIYGLIQSRNREFIIATRKFRSCIIETFFKKIGGYEIYTSSQSICAGIDICVNIPDQKVINIFMPTPWIHNFPYYIEFSGICPLICGELVIKFDAYLKKRNAGYINSLSEKPKRLKLRDTNCWSFCNTDGSCWKDGSI